MTVSVSTVMLCSATSGLVLEVGCFIEAVDCLVTRDGGAAPEAPVRISVLMLPFSLPLSFATEPAFSVCEEEVVSETKLSWTLDDGIFSDASSPRF